MSAASARARNLFLVAVGAVSLSGCGATQELQLAPNLVRLDVTPPGLPSENEATLRRAAELTLQNGYSAFRVTPIYMLAFNHFGVTVVMFHAGDPGASGAFSAEEVLHAYR